MDITDELSRHELVVLKEVGLRGQTKDTKVLEKLRTKDLIVGIKQRLQLTPKGRRTLVRGSPLLWNLTA